MRLRIFLLGLIFLSANLAFSYQDVRELSLPAEGIKKLEIRCGAGFLEVRGREDLQEIEVMAEIKVSGLREEKAQKLINEKVRLSLEKKGEKAVLLSKFHEPVSVFFSFREKLINLTVNVPKNMPLSIDDGSGWVRIENIAGEVEIDDGSGSIRIEDITGKVEIDDGSGEIQVEKIEGALEIDDGSGEIEMKSISGDVFIDDGSGDIEMKGILGSVSIVDGSGSIYVEDVQGDVEVSDGSGSINIDGVERNVTIKRAGSGSVNIRNVKGNIYK